MRDVDDTPSRLVAAAERLFAAGGEEATSLRAVTREAMSNAAAVHYHFGGRDGLLRAVLDRHLGARHERQLRLLDRVWEQHADQAPVAATVTAIVRPELELLGKLRKRRVQVARFLGRARTLESPVVQDYLDQQWRALVDHAMRLLTPAVPDVGPAELGQRLRLVCDALAMLFATASERGQRPPLGTDDVEEQLRRFVSFAAAGLAASREPEPPQKRAGGKTHKEHRS